VTQRCSEELNGFRRPPALDNNYELEQAMKWEETSIQNEDRFENWETKSRILDAIGKKEESAKALSTAFDKATAIQLYVYARGIQRSGNAKRAFELYPLVPKKDANHWVSHLTLARIESNKGDFPAAAKEMTQAISGAPDQTKPFLQPLLKRLEAKDDINK
jgi:tetratricopeptide (TPR) repeat protein